MKRPLSFIVSMHTTTSAEQPVTQTCAEQPDQEHQHVLDQKKTGNGGSLTLSAEQPVARSCTKRHGHKGYSDNAKAPQVLQDCSDWLKVLPPQDILQSQPLQRIQSAMDVLQSRSTRQQRQEVQQLLQTWNIPQKSQGNKRILSEVKADLVAKVAEEARRLKKLQDASPTTSGASFSAIQHALHHGSVGRLA